MAYPTAFQLLTNSRVFPAESCRESFTSFTLVGRLRQI